MRLNDNMHGYNNISRKDECSCNKYSTNVIKYKAGVGEGAKIKKHFNKKRLPMS